MKFAFHSVSLATVLLGAIAGECSPVEERGSTAGLCKLYVRKEWCAPPSLMRLELKLTTSQAPSHPSPAMGILERRQVRHEQAIIVTNLAAAVSFERVFKQDEVNGFKTRRALLVLQWLVVFGGSYDESALLTGISQNVTSRDRIETVEFSKRRHSLNNNRRRGDFAFKNLRPRKSFFFLYFRDASTPANATKCISMQLELPRSGQ